MVELTLELYFSVLVVDEDAEWPAVLRGERVVDKEEEAWRAMSLSMLDKVDLLLLSPEEKPPAWEIDQLNPIVNILMSCWLRFLLGDILCQNYFFCLILIFAGPDAPTRLWREEGGLAWDDGG